MHADLHTHSTASDGALAPLELALRAGANGVTHLAITDHDTLAAYDELPSREPAMPHIVPGIELSTAWRKIGVHIVGLNVDPADAGLRSAVAAQRDRRARRAGKIAERLRKCGIRLQLEDVADGTDPASLGRPHFADYLVRSGHVRDTQAAFRRYLGNGKPGDVRGFWPDPASAVGWIVAAGGTAVLAHPAHYRLTTSRLRELLREFRESGGLAIEVVSGQQAPDVTRKLGRLANEFALAASCGSDFHSPAAPWSEPGRFAGLPESVRPVWDLWP